MQDIRYGLRAFRKNWGFAALAVLTLALGIGFNSAIFSLVDAAILRPLPYPDPDQLVGLGQWRNQQGVGYVQTGVSAPNAADMAQTGLFQQVAYYRYADFNVTGGSRPESVSGIQASADLLPMFGVAPQLGRYLTQDEMEDGKNQVAILGYRLWQMRYGSDPAILGKTIDLDEKRYVIAGVMPPSFRFTWDREIDVFVPLVLSQEERSDVGRATSRDLQTQARLKSGVTIERAQAAMDTLAARLAEQYPASNKGWGFKVEPLHAAYYRGMKTHLLIMLSAVFFVLLIACANIANLLLARATGRKREVAIRIAVGATRRRLIKQLLTESLLLATLGGSLGVAFAYLGDRLLTYAIGAYEINLANARVINIDWRVLLFSLTITIGTGMLFGLAPALLATKTELNESLKAGGWSATTDSAGRRLRNALLVSEMALTLVLLTGAGLLVRSFLGLTEVDLGIHPQNVITAGISLPGYKYNLTQAELFYRDLLNNLEHTPGIQSVGIDGGGSNVFFQPQGQPAATPGHEPTAGYEMVSPNFFRAMGTPILAGRDFSDRDNAGATPVAIISETVARRYWPHSNPLGSHLTVLARMYSGQGAGTGQALEIVGVAKDVKYYDPSSPQAAVYVPFTQHPSSSVFLAVKTTGPSTTAAQTIRHAVAAIDKEQPVNEVKPMEEIVSQTYGWIRLPMTLLWIFAGLALVLSAVGIFGVMSYTVSRRTQEMAIRMALGAKRGDVVRLVLQEAAQVSALGVAVGVVAALALGRVMTGYVYGISARDPLTLTAASLLLFAVAFSASYFPARRAVSVNPVKALRHE